MAQMFFADKNKINNIVKILVTNT